MNAAAVLTAVENGVGTISLNRPEARNALSLEVRDGLARSVVKMRDDANVHTVISPVPAAHSALAATSV